MIAALVAAALAAGTVPPRGPALPEGGASYRMELAGEHVGAAELTVHCERDRCIAAWSTRTVLPEEAGGARAEKSLEVDVDRRGRSIGGATRGLREGAALRVAAVTGEVPAMIAPLVLLRGGAQRLAAWDEETGERGEASRSGPGEVTVLGVVMRVEASPDGFPAVVEIPAQRIRFVRAPEAAPPARPPRLFGTRVEGPPDAGSFCGVPRDGPPGVAPAGLPPPTGEGESCRDIALDWRRAALERWAVRIVVGVVRTQQGWAWHAWDEVRLRDGSWLPVDPTFGESPARAPRFTVARWIPTDKASRLAAGKRVLACWGEPAR